MLQWLNATASWAGPIAAILNFVIAVVGVPYALVKGYKGRKVIAAWVAEILGNTQRASDHSLDAETAAHASKKASDSAAENADAARENSRQANALLEWAIPELMRKDAVIEEMKGRIDDLLGTRARQVAAERQNQLLIPLDAGDENDPTTNTGRHRLHTSLTPIVTNEIDLD